MAGFSGEEMKAKVSDWKDRKDLGKQDIMIQAGKRPKHQGQDFQLVMGCYSNPVTS